MKSLLMVVAMEMATTLKLLKHVSNGAIQMVRHKHILFCL